MTKTTYDYSDIDARWDARRLPFADAAAVISAWTTDKDMNSRADALAASYGTDTDDLHDLLHAVRSHLRAAALADEKAVSEAVAITANMAHLINADTTDAELRALVAGAEAGVGGPVDGLLDELVRLRDAAKAERVLVAEEDAVTVTDVRPYSVSTRHVDGRVTTRCLDGADRAPRIANLGDL